MKYSLMAEPGNSGVRPKEEEIYLIAHGTIVKGQLYIIDIGTATAANHGVATSTAAAVNGSVEGSQWVYATEALTTGEIGRFLTSGYVTITNDGTNLGAEALLASDSAGLVNLAVAGDVIIGISPEAVTLTTGKAWFDGAGLGTKHA